VASAVSTFPGFPNAGAKRPGMLVLPGWDEAPERVAQEVGECAGLGFVCAHAALPNQAWAPGMRHSVTREDNLREVARAADELSLQIEPAPIGIVGTSYGGYLAVLIAPSRPVRWLILRSPALYPDEDWLVAKEALDKQDLAAYRRHLVRAEGNAALAACTRYRGHVLVVEAECDRVVPHATVVNYLAAFRHAATVTHHVLSGADHELSEDKWWQSYTLLRNAWLQEIQSGTMADCDGAPPITIA